MHNFAEVTYYTLTVLMTAISASLAVRAWRLVSTSSNMLYKRDVLDSTASSTFTLMLVVGFFHLLALANGSVSWPFSIASLAICLAAHTVARSTEKRAM